MLDLVLQVHLGTHGEEQLYITGMTTNAGIHKGSPAILGNSDKHNSNHPYFDIIPIS